MNNDTNDQKVQVGVKETPSVNDTRRKFNKAGVIAPVLMSLASKSVWSVECGVSGTMSGNLSQGCTNPTNGFTPVQFRNAAAWPAPIDKSSTKFSSIFGASLTGGKYLYGRSTTLFAVLNGATLTITSSDLKALLGCTDNPNAALKAAIMAFAQQSIASYLNSKLFVNYTYDPNSFGAPFIAQSPKASCSNKLSIFQAATDALKAKTT